VDDLSSQTKLIVDAEDDDEEDEERASTLERDFALTIDRSTHRERNTARTRVVVRRNADATVDREPQKRSRSSRAEYSPESPGR